MLSAFRLAAMVSCCITTVYAQQPVERPDAVAGPWEVSSPSRIDGVFLVTDGGQPMPARVTIKVYHRQDSRETWGWYVASPSPSDDSPAVFDGRRLRIGSGVSLDVIFDPQTLRWTGTWGRGGDQRDVVLERPRPAPGVAPNPFCGDWEGLRDPTGPWRGRFHIMQSVDGALNAWMDRTTLGTSWRYGESLQVISAQGNTIELFLSAYLTGSQWTYVGRLSGDRSRLDGRWGTNSPFSGPSLSAPAMFTRMAPK
jgi:hypothetical protein